MDTVLVGKENNEKISDMSLDWRMERTKMLHEKNQSLLNPVPYRWITIGYIISFSFLLLFEQRNKGSKTKM